MKQIAQLSDCIFRLLRSVYLKCPERLQPSMKRAFYWFAIRARALRHLRRVHRGSRVQFLAVEVADLEPYEFLGPAGDEVRVQSVVSLVSPGTERGILCGLPRTPRRFPHTPGYSAAGTVVEVGRRITDFQVGDRVTGSLHHTSHATTPPTYLFKIPERVSYEEGSFAVLGIVALQGVRKARITAGDRVAVVGQGLIGQIANRLARLAGASSVIAMAMTRAREPISRGPGGADEFLAIGEDPEAVSRIGADVVLEVVGTTPAIIAALDSARPHGRVVLVGSSRGLARDVDIWSHAQTKSLTIVGAHSSTVAAKEAAPGRWTARQEGQLFLDLIHEGRLKVDDLITRTAPADECNDVYENLADGGGKDVGIVFEWHGCH